MITTINLSPQELTLDFLQQLQKMFAGSKRIEIEIRSGNDSLLDISETPEEYKERIINAIKKVESGKNVKSFSEKEYKVLTDNLLKS